MYVFSVVIFMYIDWLSRDLGFGSRPMILAVTIMMKMGWECSNDSRHRRKVERRQMSIYLELLKLTNERLKSFPKMVFLSQNTWLISTLIDPIKACIWVKKCCCRPLSLNSFTYYSTYRSSNLLFFKKKIWGHIVYLFNNFNLL